MSNNPFGSFIGEVILSVKANSISGVNALAVCQACGRDSIKDAGYVKDDKEDIEEMIYKLYDKGWSAVTKDGKRYLVCSKCAAYFEIKEKETISL